MNPDCCRTASDQAMPFWRVHRKEYGADSYYLVGTFTKDAVPSKGPLTVAQDVCSDAQPGDEVLVEFIPGGGVTRFVAQQPAKAQFKQAS